MTAGIVIPVASAPCRGGFNPVVVTKASDGTAEKTSPPDVQAQAEPPAAESSWVGGLSGHIDRQQQILTIVYAIDCAAGYVVF